MVYPIYSVMDSGPDFPQDLSYKKCRVLQFSSENPCNISSSRHSVRPCLCAFKLVYVSHTGVIPKKLPCMYLIHSSLDHTLFFTPYFPTFPSSLPAILVTWILIVTPLSTIKRFGPAAIRQMGQSRIEQKTERGKHRKPPSPPSTKILSLALV